MKFEELLGMTRYTNLTIAMGKARSLFLHVKIVRTLRRRVIVVTYYKIEVFKMLKIDGAKLRNALNIKGSINWKTKGLVHFA